MLHSRTNFSEPMLNNSHLGLFGLPLPFEDKFITPLPDGVSSNGEKSQPVTLHLGNQRIHLTTTMSRCIEKVYMMLRLDQVLPHVPICEAVPNGMKNGF